MKLNRRDAVMSALFGAGLVGLRALASGVPASLLMNPRAASADVLPVPKDPQFLLYATSWNGDPSSCNVPGTYEDPNVLHPADPSMAATPINFGTSSVKGAKVWSGLPANVLSRTCFFHHSTYTLIHVDEGKVLRLMGAAANGEMLPTMIARELAPTLGTVRAQPITLGGIALEDVYVQGAPQPLLRPTTLASVLAAPKNGLGTMDLQKLRDRTLDKLNVYAKSRGKAAQQNFLDKYATSTTQLRTLQQNLLGTLASIKDDSQDSQIQAAIILFQMKVAPAVTIHLDFGGDNHFDTGLVVETQKHASGVATLVSMTKALAAAGLQDQVTFCMTNVFGRTLSKSNDPGRNHSNVHNVSLMIGPAIKGGVIGGIAFNAAAKDYQAQPLASATGKPMTGGDVPYNETLASVGKTLASACGVPSANIATNVLSGKVVPAALTRLT